MAAAPQIPFVPEEEYLRTDYEPNCEYVDGVLEPKALPTALHSCVQKLLCLLLAPMQRTHRMIVWPELHVRIRPGKHRIPDLAIMPDIYRRDKTVPPLVVIDVVSNSDSLRTTRARIDDLHGMGTLWTIVVDPERREVYVADTDTTFHQLRAPLLVTLPLPDRPNLSIDFDRLFAEASEEVDG